MNLRAEPVALAGAVRAVLATAVAFGLGWSAEQVASIVVAVEVVSGLWVRSKVWADANVVDVSNPEEAWELLTEGYDIEWADAAEIEAEDGSDDE